MPTWMTTLCNAGIGFQNRPLHQITLPGTHDAGCYVDHGWGRNFLARTQTQNIAQQLAGGIRYFDLRPCPSRKPLTFWTYHGPYWGGQLDGGAGILTDVANFMAGLQVTDRELVILNISHFSGFTNADHLALINAITGALGNHLVQHTQSAANAVNLFDANYVTLLTDPANANVRSRVAILYDGALDTDREAYVTANVDALPAGFFTISPKYVPNANNIFLFDQYSATNSLATLRADQVAKLVNRNGRPYSTRPWAAGAGNWGANAQGGVASTLHLFSWTLTPQPSLQDPIPVAATVSNPALPSVFSVGPRIVDQHNAPLPCLGTDWTASNYNPAVDAQINILYVDHYASHSYNRAASPLNGVAMPVAFAAQLNAGPVWPMDW